MKQTEPGTSLGVALEDFDGSGTGLIMVLVQPGWHGGTVASEALEALRGENEALRARLERLEQLVGVE